ncbi:MAG: LssY C-terminal domain-containing protein [Gammaproteobacteria bacterium]|nr:LssY C-terminal domain-containing protein [Gammaproteobacteria bacterium]MDH4314079.1 LssY C-terminal domain-containing protein [Gammaproteobacteria bacterium]
MREIPLCLTLAILAGTAVLAGCGGRAYVYEAVERSDFRERAESQSDARVQVSAAVLGREETTAVFGIDLYKQGIQPVWMEIRNSTNSLARYAVVSTDRYYFSPLEVAYKNRGGYSDEGRSEMEERFNKLAMPRYVDPGESRSGFVFTHIAAGAKGFNVDVFGSGAPSSFTFLLRVPGFVPDYANFDAASIYSAEELTAYDDEQVVDALRAMPCCSTDQSGDTAGEPVNIMLVGSGPELLKALLRSGWIETSAKEAAEQQPQFLFGRMQDAIFRYKSSAGDSLYEIRFWLAPMLYGQDRVWLGQIKHFYVLGGSLRRFDPDVDSARNFAMQKFLYGQALQSIGWLAGKAVVPAESFLERLINTPYFTDGYRLVLWLSAEPLSVANIDVKDWDLPPRWGL